MYTYYTLYSELDFPLLIFTQINLTFN